MAERDKEDVARALEGIVSGDQSDAGEDAPTPKPPRPGKPRPAAPEQVAGAPRLVPARPVVPPGAVPILPGANRPPTSSAGRTPVAPAVPSVHVPASRPPSPMRPAVPSIPSPAQIPSADAPTLDQDASAIDDDDMVIVPAPSSDVLAHRRQVAHSHAPRLATIKSLDARRTVIPILLTIGVVLVATSTLRLLTSPDTPLSTLPRWVAWVGYGVAGLLFAVALLNMVYVRHELARASPAGLGPV